MKKIVIKVVAVILAICFIAGVMPSTEAKAESYTLSVEATYDSSSKTVKTKITCNDPNVAYYRVELRQYLDNGNVNPYKVVAAKTIENPNDPVPDFGYGDLRYGSGDKDYFDVSVNAYNSSDKGIYAATSKVFSTGMKAVPEPTVSLAANGFMLASNIDYHTDSLIAELVVGVPGDDTEMVIKRQIIELSSLKKPNYQFDSSLFAKYGGGNKKFRVRLYASYFGYRNSNTIYSDWVTYDPNCKGLVSGEATLTNYISNEGNVITEGDTVTVSIYEYPDNTMKPKSYEYIWQYSSDNSSWTTIPTANNSYRFAITSEYEGKYIRCRIMADGYTGDMITNSKLISKSKIVTITFKGYTSIDTKRDGTIDISKWPTETYPGYYINRWIFKTARNTVYIRPSSTHVFNISITISPEIVMKDGVDGFVARLYKVCLDRYPDKVGFNSWKDSLVNKTNTGVSTAYGFIFSPEFKNKNLCNSDYVEYLYKAIMGRPSDKPGKKSWIQKLETGATREEVFNGFVMSQEFKGLCEKYGIAIGKSIAIPKFGTIPMGECSICHEKDGVTQFVERLYYKALDRTTIDKAGLNNWRNILWNHEQGGSQVASGFFFSSEFTNKKLSNEEYVKRLYRVLMGREPDTAGFNSWVNALKNGQTRVQVFQGFAGSQEWDGICKKYGILK